MRSKQERMIDYHANILAFYAALRGSLDLSPQQIYDHCNGALRNAPERECGRWKKWLEVLERGNKVGIKTLPGEVFTGPDASVLARMAAELAADPATRALAANLSINDAEYDPNA